MTKTIFLYRMYCPDIRSWLLFKNTLFRPNYEFIELDFIDNYYTPMKTNDGLRLFQLRNANIQDNDSIYRFLYG